MKRSIVIFVAAVAATLFVVACGPQRIEVGELQTESRSVEAENAESVRANLRMGLGELNLTGISTFSLMVCSTLPTISACCALGGDKVVSAPSWWSGHTPGSTPREAKGALPDISFHHLRYTWAKHFS